MTIYIASKVKHANRWKGLRASGVPIISTWIDEAGELETKDWDDLWRRCLSEAVAADHLILYREDGEILKGAWIELGAHMATGKVPLCVGISEFTISKTDQVMNFETLKQAIYFATGVVE